MKKSYVISTLAKEDLINVFVFSIKQFGLSQAENYRDNLTSQIEKILIFPESGIARNELLDGLRSYVFISHIIYYRLRDNTIYIERILHQSVDVAKQFKK